MSISYNLELDMDGLNNKKKRKFLAKIGELINEKEFLPFRTAINEKKEVYYATEKEYEKLLKMKKIIDELVKNKSFYRIHEINESSKREIPLLNFIQIIEHFKEIHSLPHFRYHPNVYELGVISYYTDICEVCQQESYFFSKKICVFCISNGKVAKEKEVFFNNACPTTFEEEEKINELNLRTPGIFSWQEIEWPEHCHDFCVYLRDVKWMDIAYLEDELKEALEEAAQLHNTTVDELKNELDSYMDGHLFQCLHCGTYRLAIDLP